MKPSVEMLIEKYKNNLYVMAFNVCKNAQDAEDVVQDTFIQYWSYKKEFESEQHIRAWLIRVVINKAKNKNNTFSDEIHYHWKITYKHWLSSQKNPLSCLRR